MQRAGYKITMGYVPEQGSRQIPIKLPFSTNGAAPVSDDLYPEQSLSELDYIQSVWIDNADNAKTLTIQINGGNRIVAKANTQGYYPVIAPNGKFSYTATIGAGGTVDVNIAFLNVFVNTIIWPTV